MLIRNIYIKIFGDQICLNICSKDEKKYIRIYRIYAEALQQIFCKTSEILPLLNDFEENLDIHCCILLLSESDYKNLVLLDTLSTNINTILLLECFNNFEMASFDIFLATGKRSSSDVLSVHYNGKFYITGSDELLEKYAKKAKQINAFLFFLNSPNGG